MTNNDDLALKLKQTAQLVHDNEHISNYGKLEAWKVRFRHTASPANILAMLAERDADKEEIEKLRVSNRILASDAIWKQERITELEARTVSVKLPERCDCCYSEKEAALFDGVVEEVREAFETALRAAGINLEVEE